MKSSVIPPLVLLFSVLASGPAPADEAKTRAQVKAEYQQARRDGTLPVVGPEGTVMVPQRAATPSALTRREVKDEYRAAQHDGTLPVFDGEGQKVSPQAVMGGPPLTRGQVKDELKQARRSGDISASGDENGRTERELFPQQYEYRERHDRK